MASCECASDGDMTPVVLVMSVLRAGHKLAASGISVVSTPSWHAEMSAQRRVWTLTLIRPELLKLLGDSS